MYTAASICTILRRYCFSCRLIQFHVHFGKKTDFMQMNDRAAHTVDTEGQDLPLCFSLCFDMIRAVGAAGRLTPGPRRP